MNKSKIVIVVVILVAAAAAVVAMTRQAAPDTTQPAPFSGHAKGY